jgi:hypothetical protein
MTKPPITVVTGGDRASCLEEITFSYADKADGERHFKRFYKERSLVANLS